MATPRVKTRVTNKSGASRFFAYLGPHGKVLASNASTTIDGDLWQSLDLRSRTSFAADQDAGRISALVTTDTDYGVPTGTGVTSVEVNGTRRTCLKFVNTPVVLADEAGVVAYGGLLVYTFPQALIAFIGASANLALTKSSTGVNADWDGDFGLGTVTASNNATLASTEQNFIPTTATPQAVSSATTATGISTSTEGFKLFNGTTTATPVFLNVLIDDTDHNVTGTACNIIVNGTITLVWAPIGDI